MQKWLLQPTAGPCDPPAAIEEWIDELLDLRLAFPDHGEIVAEIDHLLRQAASWLEDQRAGRRCA